MPEITVKSSRPDLNRDLIAAKGEQVGLSIEWNTDKPDTSLSPAELTSLWRKHMSRNVNTARAERVKELIGRGKGCNEICRVLRNEFGATMIKKDHAALLPHFDRGGAKNTPKVGQ